MFSGAGARGVTAKVKDPDPFRIAILLEPAWTFRGVGASVLSVHSVSSV